MTLNDAMPFHGNAATAQNGTSTSNGPDFTVKAGLAQMLKGGVIMDVVNAEQVLAHLSDRHHMLTQSSHRLALPKRQVPALSWPSSEFPLISAAMVVLPACPIPQ
jgi:hypothetical protein